MHMFAAFYFVIILSLEQEWKFSYDELISLWTLGALLIFTGIYLVIRKRDKNE